MKTSLVMKLGSLVLAAATLPAAHAAVHRITFEKPMVLTGTKIPVAVEKIKRKLDRHQNRWSDEIDERRTRLCDAKIKIEGRDIALKKAMLGEHYFGSMELACEAPTGFLVFGSPFKTTFSRVLFLGIRECVESETMVDQDYCPLTVLAMRKDSDMNRKNGDLDDVTEDERKFFVITSKVAQEHVSKHQLIPDGLNASTIDSYQLFKLSISRTGQEFVLQGTNGLSGFSAGQNFYLSPDSTSNGHDESLIGRVDAAIEAIEKSVRDVNSAGNPTEAFNAALPGILGGYSEAAKTALAVMGPADFYRLDRRLKKLEASIVELVKLYNPAIKDRSGFIAKYGAQYDELSRISGYFGKQDTRKTSLNELIDEKSDAPQVSARNDAPEVGKEYIGEDPYTDAYSSQYWWDSDGACTRAQKPCNAYLNQFNAVKHLYTCKQVNRWYTSRARICQIQVKQVN